MLAGVPTWQRFDGVVKIVQIRSVLRRMLWRKVLRRNAPENGRLVRSKVMFAESKRFYLTSARDQNCSRAPHKSKENENSVQVSSLSCYVRNRSHKT